MTDTRVQELWRLELKSKLRRVYDALPLPLRTTYRQGDALRSFDAFVECYNRLLDRARHHPRVLIAGCSSWELWLHYSSNWRPESKGWPKDELLYLECVSRSTVADGEFVERNNVMGYRDIVGETFHPIDQFWRSLFGGCQARS